MNAVVRLVEAEGISWTYFDLDSGNFGVWNAESGDWSDGMLEALLPTNTAPPEPWASC